MIKQLNRLSTLCLMLLFSVVIQAADFKDFSVIVNNQEGTLLTSDEQSQGTAVNFGIAVADDGTTIRVAADDAKAVATVSGNYHSDHGCTALKVVVPNASNVKITVGQCTYSSSAITVTDSNGNVVATKTPLSPACWKNDRSNVDVLYYQGEATTLTITGMSYCPFVAVNTLTAEEIEALNASFTLSYINTDGKEIGSQAVKGQQPIGEFKYGASDVTVTEGFAFRGWFAEATGGKKIQTTDKVESDMSLYAVTTAIETADGKASYTYDLTNANFDPADHECIEIADGGYYYNNHGWTFAPNQTIKLKVGGDATISIGGCAYSSGESITITDANGSAVGAISGKNDTDGGIITFEYEGGATTLTLTFGGRDYIHSVSIANHCSNGPGGNNELATLDNEPVSAAFAFNAGQEGQEADFGGASNYFITSKVTYGSNLSLHGTNSAGGVAQTLFMPETQQNESEGGTAADESNAIRFLIQPNFGFTFTPTKVSLKTTRYGTDNGLIDISWENPNKSTVLLEQGVKPSRNNGSPNVTELSYNIEGAKPAEGTCGLLVNLYHLQNGKQIGFADIVIEGTLSGTAKEVPVLATLTINGAEYAVEKLFGDAYEATLELTKKADMISESNPVMATAKKGDLGTVTYEGDNAKCKVTIPMTLGETTVEYVLNIIQKPDFKLTYIDTDKSTILGEFMREKDEPIGKFDLDLTAATAPEGQKVRGWYLYNSKGKTKFTTETVITSDIQLYAVATDIEVASTHAKYIFDLTDKTFDADEHEAFNPSGNYYWHDAQHGWAFKADENNKIDLLVGPKATVSVTLCRYGNADDIIITQDGKEIGKIAGKNNEDVDGEIAAFVYEGEGGTITLNLNTTGEMYIHGVKIVNTAETNYESKGNWYFVKPGDASSLIDVLEIVNGVNASKDAERSFIFLPDGIYNLGEAVKTSISGHNISIIGQSMENTVIVTAPDKTIEGLGSADMFQSSGTNLYFQDITLKNALDYYGALGNAQVGGRAAVIQDSGNRTIFKNVKMLSYQDTYYSSNDAMQSYFEDCDVHGTVDFICGGGDVRFQNTQISLEPRNVDGTGGRTVVAPRGTVKFGYVFDGCTIVDLAKGKGNWNLGRTWNNQPITVYLNTTLDENAQKTLVAKRWTEKGMNSTDPIIFGEYNTMDIDGKDITPESNKITSYGGAFETILSAEHAANYSYEMMFSKNLEKQWDPATLTKQTAAPANIKFDGTTLTWDTANDGTIGWAIFKDGLFVTITEDASYTVDDETAVYTVRAANKMGGLGEAAAAPVVITISKAGYATFFDSKTSFTLPKGLKAYVVTEATTSKLDYAELDGIIPAGTAVMLKGNKNTGYTLTQTASKIAYTGVNMLKGSDTATTTFGNADDDLFYKLAYGPSSSSQANVLGWYWGAANGTAFQIEGHRAWLAIPQSAAARRGYRIDDDGTTGISPAVTINSNEDNEFFNLQGQRVASPTKGIYIRNNKKIIIK